MKFSFLIIIFFFISCFPDGRNLETVTYSIPNGRKVLFIHTIPSSFSDSYSEEKELSLRILEELEESGFLVVLGESIWEEPVINFGFSERLEIFQNRLKDITTNETPRIQIWKDRAERMGASDVFLLRHSMYPDSKTKSLRMFWINLTKKEMIRFDWSWDFKDPLPFREKLLEVSGGKP
ncbi:hypothetical protein [Leptospira kanakyensis]|uniref:hypothetical protein n=1 Tax=Leptospira kanakyensis TaxID=2484968 RepID=UPI00223E66B9|nr:hypothetical protein [Leptospira kanakyensis]MCW7470144.1 hypothetical protein [Leptospira kanakyensis]MCW7481124.1 hypothetical protein [Leptospira kanakyensis]